MVDAGVCVAYACLPRSASDPLDVLLPSLLHIANGLRSSASGDARADGYPGPGDGDQGARADVNTRASA